MRRDAYDGPKYKSDAPCEGGWTQAPKYSGREGAGEDAWGDDEREVVDDRGNVWITSSPARKIPKEYHALKKESGAAKKKPGGIAGALTEFYAARNITDKFDKYVP